MKKKTKSKKKSNLIFRIIAVILILCAIAASGFIIYFEVLPINYLSLFIIGVGLLVFFFSLILMNKRLKKWIKTIVSIPSFALIFIFLLICFYSLGTNSFFEDIFDLGFRHDSYSVYVLESSQYESINELNSKRIGMSEKSNEVGSKALDKISSKIEFNKIDYENVIDSIEGLNENKVEAIVALDSNIDILKEEDEDYNNLKSIYTFTITSKVDTVSSSINVDKENFVVYLSGIDVNGKVATKAKSDVNIIVAVNPSKKKMLMLNTPRDYYVKLPTKNAMDKLTHAGVYGIEESMGALENLYDIDINYYARINFTSFINIVEELDGIEVDVPVSFCEQTSSRTSDRKICLKKGLQTLNGEQALALARTRHTLAGGDRSRIENQLLLLRAIFDKIMSPSIIVKYNDLLSSLSKSVVTNIKEKDITKLIKKQIKDNDEWSIETFTVDGSDGSNITYSTGRAKAYVMIPDEKTVMEAKIKLDKILETNKYKDVATGE